MARIPIYDAGAPIACTIDDDEVAGRLDPIERLRASRTGIERTEHGLLLR